MIIQLFIFAAVFAVVGDLTKQEKNQPNNTLKKRSDNQHFDTIFTFYDPIQLKY